MKASRKTGLANDRGRRMPQKATGKPTARKRTKGGSPLDRPKSTAAAPTLPAVAARRSKKTAIIALLQRPEGADISDLTDATGWLVHSVRAALTGLRKEGKGLVRSKDAVGATRYRLPAEA